MHSRTFASSFIATFGVAVACWPETARALEWYDGQEILVECPTWDWEASQIPGVSYELCFDDIEHCVAAEIGDPVCIPGLGEHDVWVTAIDEQGGEPVYYDGEIASIHRVRSADFNDNGVVELADLFALLDQFGISGETSGDLDGNGVVDLADLMALLDDLGKCVNDAGHLYETC